MVFVNEAWNGTGEIVVYSNYHKYWLDRERKIKNPLFDVFSGKILDLKDKKPSAIKYFYNLLDCEICPVHDLIDRFFWDIFDRGLQRYTIFLANSFDLPKYQGVFIFS